MYKYNLVGKVHLMNVLSLFDGISCGQLALQRAGVKVDKYFASEIDKYAIKVTQKNFPNTIQIGDVRNICGSDFKKVDLLMGGSPCQSLSITRADTRQGLNGKSKLFFEYVRLLNEINPKYFLLENVASMSSECKQIISEYMGCDPLLINSNCFSAQDRPRFYWTNIAVNQGAFNESTLCLKDIMEDSVDEKYFYNYPLSNINMEKQVCAIMNFKNNEMHKRIFNPKFKVHTLTTCGGGNTQKKVMDKGRARKLTPLEYERLQTLPDNYTDCLAATNRYTVCGNGWTVDVIAHILKNI